MNEKLMRDFIAIYAACTRASLRAMGMQSRNLQCMMKQQRPVYLEEDFEKVMTEECIHYNDIQGRLYHN